MHVTEEINVGEVTFTGSGPVLTQEMLKQINIDWGLDEYLSQSYLPGNAERHWVQIWTNPHTLKKCCKLPWTSLSSKPWITTLKTISSLSLCRTIVSFIVRGLSAVTAVKMSHTFNIIKTLRFETHFIELRHIMKINNVISLLCAPNWWTKLFGIKIAQGTNNKKELTLLDRGLSLSTSFVLSMSIWAAVATPKTSWDLEIPHTEILIFWLHTIIKLK